MLLRLLIVTIVFSCSSLSSNAQDEDSPYSYELNAGINFNTNGGVIGGISGRFGRKMGKNSIQTFSLDIVEVKHLKEQRTSSIQTGQAFIYGKQNHLFVVRPQYGREFILFKKYPEEGIRLSAIVAGGPSFGLVKPYYVEYDASTNDSTTNIQVVPYSEELFIDRVLSGGFPLKGFGETKVNVGFNFKVGLNFEFGRKSTFESDEVRVSQNISGIEAGFSFEKYGQDIPLLAFAQNKSTFTAVYVILYYGKRW